MIIKNLQKLVDTGEQLYAKVCRVHRVDQDNKCCDVIPVDGSAELFEVPFYLDEADGLCAYPAENSHVLVVFLSKHHACICGLSKVDLVKLTIDKVEFSIDKDGFLLKKKGEKDETLKKLMDDLLKTLQEITYLSSAGTCTLEPTKKIELTAIQKRFNNFLKEA